MVLRLAAALALLGQGAAASAQALDDATLQELATRFDAIQPRMVEWRRDIHQHPELSGQEVLDFAYPYGAWNTAALPHLQKAGYRSGYQLQEKGIDHEMPQYTLRRILTVSTWTGDQVVKALAKV